MRAAAESDHVLVGGVELAVRVRAAAGQVQRAAGRTDQRGVVQRDAAERTRTGSRRLEDRALVVDDRRSARVVVQRGVSLEVEQGIGLVVEDADGPRPAVAPVEPAGGGHIERPEVVDRAAPDSAASRAHAAHLGHGIVCDDKSARSVHVGSARPVQPRLDRDGPGALEGAALQLE